MIENILKIVKKYYKYCILNIIEISFICIFLGAVIYLGLIWLDYKEASTEYKILSDELVEDFVPGVSKESYNYEISMYSVDLASLKEQNKDTVGWIILPDSKIDYPIVKSKDNEEYLSTTFGGRKSNSGAIFMDMYCANDFSCDNVIIYGHNMKDGSMFRALNNMTDKEYFLKHHIFSIDIGSGFEEYEVISCYETIDTDLDAWQRSFETLENYENWLNTIVQKSLYDCMDYDVYENTITLSTCRGKAGGSGRFIVHLQKK